jgi:hypothetical protein
MGHSVAGSRRWMTRWLGAALAALLSTAGLVAAAAAPASAATPNTLDLKVLLIADGNAAPETAAWEAALTSEGVPYTAVPTSGTAPNETVTLPTLSSGNIGAFNAVVITGSPTDFAANQLNTLDSYESTFGVRQLDGYIYPDPNLGVTDVTGGALDGTTGALTAAGTADFPALAGAVPFDSGSYGYGGTATGGTAYTPLITESFPATATTAAGTYDVAGIYQHPGTDPQAGVQELSLNFDYNANQLQWLVLSPGLINWVTQDTHLGLYRNYFGQDIDDNFIADNQWSNQYQCTPAATDPPDYTCPTNEQGQPQGTNGAPPDVQMSAADVAYVAAWEKSTGITLNMAFNAIGACTEPATTAGTDSAVCTGGYTDPSGTTYTDPGLVTDSGYPDDTGLVNALLADQADFNWIIHTWSHLFLGCQVWSPQALTSATAGTGGSLAAGTYSYEITAATAYGESEPSTPAPSVTVGAGGSVTLTWPDATNGTGTSGTPGPTLPQLESEFGGGTGFWGYNIYRASGTSGNYQLVGQVAENASSGGTYTFTDTGATTPGEAPGSGPDFPSATNPGIDCSSAPASWLPASSTAADDSIDAEIGLDQAFAKANGFTNYTPSAVVTGEHSGLENPNMPTAFADTGITTFAQDGSRQPKQYSLGGAEGAPRYPSNIYYNAPTWADEINEYNTLYVAQNDSIGDPTYTTETGRCTDTTATTCLTTSATETSILASESKIMLGHVLDNNPRVGYAHQTNLIGPDYTILTLISDMLSQYNTWYNTTAPLDQMTDVTEAGVLQDQSAWATAEVGTGVTATDTNGVVTVTNSGAQVGVPITVPAGTTVTGSTTALQSYGGSLSNWVPVGTAPVVLTEPGTAPVITSGTSATSNVGAAFSYTITTTGTPTPTLTCTAPGSTTTACTLPAGLTFTDNGNGTATIAGSPATGSGGSYLVQINATNSTGGTTQAFTLTNDEAPSITSPSTATFYTGVTGTYTITTTGYPAPTLTETGNLPAGMTFSASAGTISGTPTATGNFPVSITATNTADNSSVTLALTITVTAGTAPALSIPAADFTLNQGGSVTITTTGSPTPAITETGTVPGLTFTDNGDGTATLSGTPTATGTTTLNITAANGVTPNAAGTMTVIVGTVPGFTSANTATVAFGSALNFAVTTSGYPAPSLGASGLPAGATFTDNNNGTATLAGTPTTAGTYTVILTAASPYGTVMQTLTLTVQAAPAITSTNAATFTSGTPGSLTVTTTGGPTPAISTTSALPAGVTLTDNGDGTATLASTAATAAGSYPITITAANGVSPNATQSFTLTVNAAPAAPAITSANAAAFTAGTAGTFTVTTTGNPTAAISTTSALPAGVTLTDNGNGTATLASTAATAAGSYPITITAANGISPNATQNFTLTVNPVAPVITSASGTTFSVGTAGTFSVTTTGNPTAVLSATSSPALPSGVTFTPNSNGTATLSGTPPAGSQGTYTLTITAKNSGGTATQSFVLTVNSGLAITSAASDTVTSGKAFSFAVTTTGTPTPTLTHAGGLPSGVTFTDNGNGTATLAGTPAATAKGPYPITFTARNSTGTASQAFTLTVANPPTFTSAAAVTETAGTAFTFTVATTAYPTAALSATGLPTGVTFSDNGNGTGSLSGTTAVAAGTYTVTATATNSGGTSSQTITLTVNKAGTTVPVPTFTSAASATATAGKAFSFTATTVGSPTTTYTTNVTHTGTLPAGLSFDNLGNGTATITGTPTAASGGTYTITLTAKNSAGTVTQSFVLTVSAAPTITSAASATATVGSSFNFTVKATGAPAAAMTEGGALPSGLTWVDNGNGTATLAGTPGVNVGGVYNLTFMASNTFGAATQAFTLTVRQAPAITSASSATAVHGVAMKPFTFTSTGYPVPNVTHTGSIPGLTYTNNGNGTATLSGTPRTAGTYTLTITAKNNTGTATQTFTLTVS